MKFCAVREIGDVKDIATGALCRLLFLSFRDSWSAAAAAVAANIEIDDAISGHEVQPHVPGSSRPITHAMHWRGTAVNSIAFTHNYRRISNFDSRVSILSIAPCFKMFDKRFRRAIRSVFLSY